MTQINTAADTGFFYLDYGTDTRNTIAAPIATNVLA